MIIDRFEQQQNRLKGRMAILNDEISNKESARYNVHMSNDYTETTESSSIISRTLKKLYCYFTDDTTDINVEIDELKAVYSEMEMQVKLLKDKTMQFSGNFISKIKFTFQRISGQILAIYCIYRIVMTLKNLLFQNYSDINIMLRDQVLNIIDFSLNIVFHILKLDVETIYYTVIEQYFSLLIVGCIIIVNIRSFLLTILFIYTKTLKRYSGVINKKVQSIFLSYFVGLFYVTSSIFLIFNLPITYRYF